MDEQRSRERKFGEALGFRGVQLRGASLGSGQVHRGRRFSSRGPNLWRFRAFSKDQPNRLKNMKHKWSALAVISWLSLALPSASIAAPASRHAGPEFAVGMAVVDDAGNPVGNIQSIDGNDVVVRTDSREARIPRASFRLNRGRLVMGMTRAQLNAAVERLAPPPPVQIEAGVLVRGTGGAVAGTIEAVDQDHVILRLTTGERASLPRSSVGTSAQGAVLSVTAEELQRLVEAATPTTSGSAPATAQ